VIVCNVLFVSLEYGNFKLIFYIMDWYITEFLTKFKFPIIIIK